MELEKEYSCLEKNELVFCKAINLDKNYQETPEAYLDDIFKVVKCTAHSYVTSCDIKDSTVYIIGKTEICLTYYNEQNELLYTDFVEDFNESIAIDSVSEYAFGIVTVCNKYCNFRIINQRRIDIHTSFALMLAFMTKRVVLVFVSVKNQSLKNPKKRLLMLKMLLYPKLMLKNLLPCLQIQTE